MKKNIILIVFALLLLGGCKKDKDVHVAKVQAETPDVTTTANAADISGTYSYASTLKSVVIVYGKDASLSSLQRVTAEHTRDSYSVTINNLDPSTKYYYYCIFDTGYGATESEQRSFTTQSILVPTVTTAQVSNITQTTAICGGEVTSDGGAAVTARGVCWSTSQNPTVSNSHTTDGSGTGNFTSSITGLTASTTYYVRAYATNSAGTSYGEQRIFTTDGGYGGDGEINGYAYVNLGLPSGLLWATCNVGADSPKDYGKYYAWGETTTKGSYEWRTYRWCNDYEFKLTKYNTNGSYGTVDNRTVLEPADDVAHVKWGDGWRMPTKAEMEELNDKCTWTWTTHNGKKGCRVTGPNGKSIFMPAAGLYNCSNNHDAGSRGCYWSNSLNTDSPNQAYLLHLDSDHVYAESRSGRCFGLSVRPVYGSQNVSVPTVTTSSVSNISQTTATCGGNVTGDGGAAVSVRGVCWSTSQNPTVNNNHTTDGGGTGSFTSSITGLTANTTYYVRAYATNSAGTSYGEQRTFTTQSGGGTQTTPTVTTSSVSSITQTTATCGGNVTSDGGATVTVRGVCWSTSQNPTVNNNHTTDGGGTGSFTSSITGLTANTTYYVRAYATNSAGTSYGEQRTFTTQSGGGTQTVPTVTTAQVSNITQTTATCGGNVTSDGGAAVTARGVCWSTSQNPTVSNSHTTDGSGTGNFTSSITGLTASTTYYVRAYATNSAGTSYGEQRIFTTPQNITSPTVTTNNVTDITQTAATCGGSVTSDGGAAVTARGVCWSTSQNPTVSDSHTTDGSGTGSFTSSITGLTANTTYYVRAYATNSAGTSYGEQKSFTTLQDIALPTVTTNNVTDIMQTTATCGGEVTSDGGAAVTARGVCWSTSQNPTVSNSHTTDGSGIGSFTSSITGLTASTTYYVRAYATNSAGTSYGEQESFTTQSGGGTGDHEYVDLGLPSGLLWATCNVGADSPEGYGWYFMWGSTTNGGDPDCTWANCPGNGGSSGYNSSAIAAWDATHLTNNVLNPEVDAASVNWGGDWRMPTSAEWQELYDNTTCTWTAENGVNGRKFTSKTDATKYIFLPAAGIRNGTVVSTAGSKGDYWSGSLLSSTPDFAYNLFFNSGNVYPQVVSGRFGGYTVRPVRAAR